MCRSYSKGVDAMDMGNRASLASLEYCNFGENRRLLWWFSKETEMNQHFHWARMQVKVKGGLCLNEMFVYDKRRKFKIGIW